MSIWYMKRRQAEANMGSEKSTLVAPVVEAKEEVAPVEETVKAIPKKVTKKKK